MKELPILFSTPMVQAILDGRKTMTRRIVKTTRSGWDCQTMKFALSKIIQAIDTKISSVIGFHAFFQANDSDHKLGTMCHYGQPGDLLWVRESFIEFPADHFNFRTEPDPVFEQAKTKWKPSIHMPKAAARIWLQVEEIRVERLQGISEEDIKSEGIEIPSDGKSHIFFKLGEDNSAINFLPDGCLCDGGIMPTSQQIYFAFWAELWCKINGRESWDLNPWVWVVKFKTLSTTGRPELAKHNSQPEIINS